MHVRCPLHGETQQSKNRFLKNQMREKKFHYKKCNADFVNHYYKIHLNFLKQKSLVRLRISNFQLIEVYFISTKEVNGK